LAEKTSGLFGRLAAGLSRTRSKLTGGVATLLVGRKQIDEELLEELEAVLLGADLGVESTEALVAELHSKLSRNLLKDADAVYAALREGMLDILQGDDVALELPSREKPNLILLVGVNGAGKTTTAGKLANRLQQQGHRLLMAAADTFRAAAVEQLQAWGERSDVPVIAQHSGADPAAVVFDALSAAAARNRDVVIADTSGRLHTQGNLMAELSKIGRVAQKADPEAPAECLLVLDASTGQNGLIQAEQFGKTLALSGVILTKLDGTARGGVIFAIRKRLGLPVKFIGVGEGVEDLRPFDAEAFVDALLDREL